MKALTRDRVVPTISASVSWLTLAMIGSGLPSLINQVLFNAGIPGQKVRHEHLGKRWLVMKHAHNGRFVEPHDHASCHCLDGRQASGLAGQTAFAKEIPISMNRNDGLFSSLRYDCDLDLPSCI
jgi:hypothetical protein